MRNPINVPPRMDAVIDYDEAAGFLKNPPSLEPRPNFTNIRALQKHIVQALTQLSCPQSTIHGWSGLAMDLALPFAIAVAIAIAVSDAVTVAVPVAIAVAIAIVIAVSGAVTVATAVDVAVNVAIARCLYHRCPCCRCHRTINVSISVSDAVAVAVAFAITLSDAIAIAITDLIAITIAVTIADAVTVAVTVAIAITDASSSHRIHFPSSASPLIASTSFQPSIVSWRLLSFAGRLIVM
jgi:hypothetical protein